MDKKILGLGVATFLVICAMNVSARAMWTEKEENDPPLQRKSVSETMPS